MNSFLTINKLTKTLAGVLAMLATLVVIGAPLTLAEYYANTDAADYGNASSVATRAAPTISRKS